MEKYGGFHDSVIVSMNYISGSKTVEKGLHCVNDVRQVSIIFDGNGAAIEMVFEGILLLNLRPTKEDLVSIIYSATIIIEDGVIYFFNDDLIGNPEDFEYTWIKALGLRWRFLIEGESNP